MNYKYSPNFSWDTNKDTHSKFISDFKTKNKLKAVIIYGILSSCADAINQFFRMKYKNTSLDLKEKLEVK